MTQSQFRPAYMGEFLRTYEPPILSLNKTINLVLTRPSTFAPSAILTREVQFPDASFYQGEIDYSIMATKTDAIIIRAGQNAWVDIWFERNYSEATAYGLLKGIYWFYDDRKSPGEQATLLVSILRGKHIEMEVWIDWETSYGGQFKGLPNVVAMMQAVERANLDIKGVGLYTGYYWFRANSNPIKNASQYAYLKTKPLWEAWYTSNPANVLIPVPWTSLTYWQFGTPVVFWGQRTSELDMNWFNGSQQDFNQHYGGTTPPPPNGGTMQIIKGTALGDSKIRRFPAGVEFNPPRYLLKGSTIEADKNESQWLHLTKINGVVVPEEEWVSAGSTQQYIQWHWEDVSVDSPPPTAILKHTILVYDDGSLNLDGTIIP